MLRILLLLLFGLAACSGAAAPPMPEVAASAPAETPRVEPWAGLWPLLGRLAEEPFGTGAVVSVAQGDLICTLARGTRGADGAPVRPDSMFNLASVSKVLTASRVVALAQAGRLDLDAGVARYLPGVRLLDPAGRDVTDQVTVRHLLEHRSGLPHQPGDQLRGEVFENRWDRPDLLQKITADWSLRLAFAPGETHYSNMGYVLLGALVEKLDACDFPDCMARHLRALGLKTATFRPAEAAGLACDGRVATAGPEAFHPPDWYFSAYAGPFSGAWMSMPELARFGVDLHRAAASPADPLHPMTRPPASGRGFGLGLVHGRRGEERVWQHDGSGPGFLARLVVLPDQGWALAVATNGGRESKDEGRAFHDLTESMLGVLVAGAAAPGAGGPGSGFGEAAGVPVPECRRSSP